MSWAARLHDGPGFEGTAHRRRCRCHAAGSAISGPTGVARRARAAGTARTAPRDGHVRAKCGPNTGQLRAKYGPRACLRPPRAGSRNAASACIVPRPCAPRCRTATVLHRTTSVPRCITAHRAPAVAASRTTPDEPCAAGLRARFAATWHGVCVSRFGRINGDSSGSTDYRRARQRASWATASYASGLDETGCAGRRFSFGG